ncbi:MAG: cyclase family protein [Acidimicrobiales bacterium]|nr:cyclase family protein [Acidimicrobiales bacterium]
MRLLDLSHVIEDGMVTYPGIPGPVVSDHLTREASRSVYAPGTEFQLGRLELIGNTGTYLDAPFHRYADGHDLAEVPLSAVAGLPAVVVDADGPAIGSDVFEHLGDLTGQAILVRTGWSQHWRTPTYGGGGHPHLTSAATERLVELRPALVGIDSLNIDDTSTGERPAHSGLLAAEIYVLEHLTALADIDDPGFELFAVPLKVRGMGTSPVRAFALWR